MQLSLFHDVSSETHFRRFQTERVLERLRSQEDRVLRDGLENLDPASDELISIGAETDSSGRLTKDAYGVFNLSWQAESHPEWPQQIEEEIRQIRLHIRETHGAPLRFLIWAGMGGSAEDKSMYNVFGLLKRGIRCYVLDSTDPSKLKCILEDMTRRSRGSLPAALRSTLVVGMAMGMTSYEPVINLEALTTLYDRHKINSRPNFIYMTLPGSLLDQFAGPRGYRKIELQLDGRNTTAGRHSGPLTRGSLYPLALGGVDLRAWISGTFLSAEEIQIALRLAAFLHAQGEAGRDKVTLLLGKPWSDAALWTKQDFEESLGKSEVLGVKVIIGEKLKPANYWPAGDPRQDRVFLAIQTKGKANLARATAILRRDGLPVAVVTLKAQTLLSRYMQFVHYVVFGMGYLRKMNFVTQPSVELYKSITNRLYAEAQQSGGPQKIEAWRKMHGSPEQAKWKGAVTLFYGGVKPILDDFPAKAPAVYARILSAVVESRQAEYAELTFFGDTRYCAAGRQLRKSLDRAAERLFRSRLKIPVDVYEGPAMNHSYHEMIIGHGKCFSTILISARQEQLPGAHYRADYHLTQFLATKLALGERNRLVVAIMVRDLSDKSLAALDDFFEHASRLLK